MFVVHEPKAKAFIVTLEEPYGTVLARASLFIISNELHDRPYGLLEDVWACENIRGKGYGKSVVETVIEIAMKEHCYKLIAVVNSGADRLVSWYEKEFGLKVNTNVEMRLDL